MRRRQEVTIFHYQCQNDPPVSLRNRLLSQRLESFRMKLFLDEAIFQLKARNLMLDGGFFFASLTLSLSPSSLSLSLSSGYVYKILQHR